MATHKSYQLGHPVSRDLDWGKIALYNILWAPLRIFFNFFARLEVESKEDLASLEGPLIVASSHGSWSDSFIIGISFPFGAKSFPIRYATLWKYYYFPLFTFPLWLLGNFPVRKGIGLENSLAVPIKILKRSGVIGIFPTGKRVRNWNRSEKPQPKRGVAYLAMKTNSLVLPVKIEGNVGMKFSWFLLRKYRIKVKIGRTFYLAPKDLENKEELAKASGLIMEKIDAL